MFTVRYVTPDFETEEPWTDLSIYEEAILGSEDSNVVVSDVNPRDYDNKRSPKILENMVLLQVVQKRQ